MVFVFELALIHHAEGGCISILKKPLTSGLNPASDACWKLVIDLSFRIVFVHLGASEVKANASVRPLVGIVRLSWEWTLIVKEQASTKCLRIGYPTEWSNDHVRDGDRDDSIVVEPGSHLELRVDPG